MEKCEECYGTGSYCRQFCCKAHRCAYCKGTGKVAKRVADAVALGGA